MLYLCNMKLDFTSVKKFESYLAQIGLNSYGIDKAREDVKTADEMGLFKNAMQKKRILDRIKELTNSD